MRYANEYDNYGGVVRSGADGILDNTDWILDIIAGHITRNVPRTRIVLKPLTKGFLAIPTNKMVNYIAEKLRNDVAQKYENIGETIRDIAAKLRLSNEMVFEVAETYETSGDYARTIAENFDLYVIDKPPFRIDKDFKDLSGLLLTFSERETVARVATSNLDKLPIGIKIKLIELISRTISCDTLEGPNVYKNFVFDILDKLRNDASEEVRTRAEELVRS